jgi:hypothetical protein
MYTNKAKPDLRLYWLGIAAYLAILANLYTASNAVAQQPDLSHFTPLQQEMIRGALAGPPSPIGGQVHGYVLAATPDDATAIVPLAGAEVFLSNASEEIQGSAARTRADGWFGTPNQAPGFYRVCARLQGFETACSRSPVEVTDHTLVLESNIILASTTGAVRGRVELNDGTPAIRGGITPVATGEGARVWITDESGRPISSQLEVNRNGEFVLPAPQASQGTRVHVEFEGQQTDAPVTTNGAMVEIVLPEGRPVLRGISINVNGRAVQTIPPGATVTLSADASDPKGNPLRFRWFDSSGNRIPGDGPSVTWTTPAVNVRTYISLEVSNGKGGLAMGSFSVLGGATVAPSTSGGLSLDPLINPGVFLNTLIDPTKYMNCADEDICKGEAKNYYQAIGVFDAVYSPTSHYETFAKWKEFWGFSADPAKYSSPEVRAVYYNNGDLGLGRDMHCLPLGNYEDSASPPPGKLLVNVCYVTNYGDIRRLGLGSDPEQATSDAIHAKNPFATVAMESFTSSDSVGGHKTNAVRFIVFAPGDTSAPFGNGFVPQIEAKLDGQGPKAVPGVCLACHGAQTYDTKLHSVSAARFLPFDTASFIYNQADQKFWEASQTESFRLLNLLVRNSQATFVNPTTAIAIRDLIDGWYQHCGGVDVTGCALDQKKYPFTPSKPCAAGVVTCGWGAGQFSIGSLLVYDRIIRPYCRTCHTAQADHFNAESLSEFEDMTKKSQINYFVFTYPVMPHAQVPYLRFHNDTQNYNALKSITTTP